MVIINCTHVWINEWMNMLDYHEWNATAFPYNILQPSLYMFTSIVQIHTSFVNGGLTDQIVQQRTNNENSILDCWVLYEMPLCCTDGTTAVEMYNIFNASWVRLHTTPSLNVFTPTSSGNSPLIRYKKQNKDLWAHYQRWLPNVQSLGIFTFLPLPPLRCTSNRSVVLLIHCTASVCTSRTRVWNAYTSLTPGMFPLMNNIFHVPAFLP